MSDNQLQVFISWSKEPSKQIAKCVRNLLIRIFPDPNISFFLSSGGISAGENFVDILARYLENSCFGILILTNNNFAKEWLMYEAGALAKGTKEKETKPKLCPILFTREKEQIESPLKSFQHTIFEKESFFDLISAIKQSLFRVKSLNEFQKAQLKHSLNEEWSDFEQKVKRIIQEHPDGNITRIADDNEVKQVIPEHPGGNITRITNDYIVQLLMGENIYHEILPTRDIHLQKLINNLEKDSSERIIIFGGISTILRKESAIRAFVEWIIKNPNSKLFICHDNADVASERTKALKSNAYDPEISKYLEIQQRKVTELQMMKETLLNYLGEKLHRNVSFIEIIKPISIYVTIHGNTLYLTPLLDKRASRTFTLKLKDSQYSEEVLDYLYKICENSNNNETLLKEIKLVSEKLRY